MKKNKQKKCKNCNSEVFETKKVSLPDSLDNVVEVLVCKKCGTKQAKHVEHIG